MSTKKLEVVNVKLAEPDFSHGHVGFLPSDHPLLTTETALNIFYPSPWIAPLGYMGDGPGLGEISFQPKDVYDIPAGSIVTGLTFTIRAYLKRGIMAPEDPRTTAIFYRIIPADESTTTPVEDMTLYPSTVFTPTEEGVEYTIDFFNKPALGGGWTLSRALSTDSVVWLSRFGITTRDYDPKNPLIISNAYLNMTFTLPVPIIVETTDVYGWTIVSGQQDMIWEFFGPIAGGVRIPAGTYTDGEALAQIIRDLIAAMPDNGLEPVDYATFEYKSGTRTFVIGFQWGPHFFYGSALPALNFNTNYVDVWSAESNPITLADRTLVDVKNTSAVIRGTVNPNGATLTYPVTAYAEYYIEDSADAPLTTDTVTLVGNTALRVAFKMEGLIPEQTYSVRIAAETADGITYGSVQTFTTTANDLALTEG